MYHHVYVMYGVCISNVWCVYNIQCIYNVWCAYLYIHISIRKYIKVCVRY